MKRKDFLAEIAGLAESLRLTIEAEVDGFKADPAASAARVAQAKTDFGFFARTYFPHYIKSEPSALHRYLFERLPQIVKGEKGAHDCLAAPRGEAKSTICSLILPIYCVVFELKWFMPLIMDAFDQSATLLEALKVELESNPRLLMDFPAATGRGRVWQVGVIVTANNRKLQAFGSGKRMRGLRHGPHRPDLTICDDLENDENVRSPDQRDKLERWLKRTVLKLGPPDGSMDILVIGTVLHHDSVLARLLKSPTWNSRKFKALIEWPHRMDLWDTFEEKLANHGEEAAVEFYRERQAEMDQGSVVSWPAQRPLLTIMLIRADDHSAFDSEFQNDPISSEDNPFANILTFWVNRINEWIFYGACDPSLGKNNKGRDPSAILVGGFNRESGVLDVVEGKVQRRVPDKIIEDIIALQAEYKCIVWGVEAVQFQEFLRTELIKRSAQQGIPVPAQAVIPHADKDLRIESLQPHVANGLIRFHPSQKTLIHQFRHWPDDHDDGPDAAQILWMLAVSRSGGVPKVQSAGRRVAASITKGYD